MRINKNIEAKSKLLLNPLFPTLKKGIIQLFIVSLPKVPEFWCSFFFSNTKLLIFGNFYFIIGKSLNSFYKNIVTFNNETNIFFYDIVKNQLVRKMNLNSFTIYGTIYCFINEYAIILGNDTTISAFDYIQEKILWQYDLETYFHQPAQIMEGRVLVSNNKIIFFAHTEDWSNYATFILDAQTGEVLFTTQKMGMKLVEHNNLVYQIQRKAIKILDPKNLKIETIDISAYCDDQSIFLDDHTVFFYKDKLYTLAREQGSDVYNIWVVFNLKTQQFEHREDMYINPKKKKDEKNKMFINDIQANDNLVAIRCSDNLYIFEKELDE